MTDQTDVTTIEEKMAKTPILSGKAGLQLITLDDYYRFAQYVIKGKFAPTGMTNAESVLIAMQMGAEIGLPPMQALQNIAVINGRPSVWGDAAKGLVEGSGLCEEFSEWFEGEPYKDDFKAVCEVRRVGREKSVRWEFSVTDAKLAQLWGKKGPWSQYPKRMLQMRARGFACRDAFPDVLRGLRLAQEVQDMEPIDVTATPIEDGPQPETLDDLKAAMRPDDDEPMDDKETQSKGAEAPAEDGQTKIEGG